MLYPPNTHSLESYEAPLPRPVYDNPPLVVSAPRRIRVPQLFRR